MTEVFAPCDETLELKKLGIGKYITYACGFYYTLNGKEYKFATPSQFDNIDETYDVGSNFYMVAPIYQQAFQFFREKYNLISYIRWNNKYKPISWEWVIEGELFGGETECKKGWSYEEAQLSCLQKLIEIIKISE